MLTRQLRVFQLRRDNENHEIRRQLGQIQVLQSDLLPLLKLKDSDSGQDPELFDMVLRVLVNLTNPELLLFREELPEEKVTRNYYMQLQGHRQQYKVILLRRQTGQFALFCYNVKDCLCGRGRLGGA